MKTSTRRPRRPPVLPCTLAAEELLHARRRGEAAFAAGIDRAPAMDPAICSLLGQGAGNDIPLLRAWLQGWDDANLAAPGEG